MALNLSPLAGEIPGKFYFLGREGDINSSAAATFKFVTIGI
jgi:hypothetical protein